MSKAYTIDDVVNYLEQNDVKHECTLLSTEYINKDEKLSFRCNICGKKFERTFSCVMKDNKYSCRVCSQGRRNGIEYVRAFLLEHDKKHECELLSTKYENVKSYLQFKCNICGKTFNRRFCQVRVISNHCCVSCCKARVVRQRCTFTIDQIKEKIVQMDTNKDCELLSTTYENSTTPLLFRCNCCGNTFQRTWQTMNSKQAFKCFACAHGFDPNGTSDIYRQNINYFRHKIRPWRDKYLQEYPYCDITGRTDMLEVHHLINFQTILNMASENTNIPLIYSPKEYSQHGYDINEISKEIVRLHKEAPAVVLTKEIHHQFHKLFGYKNNVPEQYYTFKESYKA